MSLVKAERCLCGCAQAEGVVGAVWAKDQQTRTRKPLGPGTGIKKSNITLIFPHYTHPELVSGWILPQ